MPFRIIGTSPDGAPWHHSSHYATRWGVAAGLAKAVEQEAARAETLWVDAVAHARGLRPGESIALPNRWVFRIEEDPA